MSIKQTIILDVKTSAAQKDVDNLKDSLEGVNKEIGEVGKKSEKELGKASDGAKKGSKGIGGMSKAFKGLGTAIKAAGIGLVIAAFAAVAKVVSQNQAVMDKLNVAWEVISLAINDLISYISDNALPVFESFKKFFENLTFDKIKKAIKENLIERFESLLEVVGFLGSAIKKLFSGDFKGALDSVKEAGKEMVDAFTGVDNTLGKVTELVVELAEATSNYGAELIKTAENTIALNKAALISVAVQGQLTEIYDRQAEQQRQLRDDTTNSIADRITANDELLVVLDKQEKAMLATADAQIAAAQAAVDKNANDENQIALIDAQTNKLGILAQIEGFRSEQKINEIGLDQELLELSNSKAESDAKLAIDAKRFAAERITDDELRIIRLREILEEEKVIEEERLQLIIDSTTLGTQARVDAQIAFDEKMQELEQTRIELQTVNTDTEIGLKKNVTDASFKAFDALVTLFGQETILGKAVLVAKQVAAAAEIAIGISKIQFKATETAAVAAMDGAKATTSIASGTAVTLSAGFPAAIPLLIGYAAAAIGIVSGIVSAVKSSKQVAAQFGGSVGGSSPTPAVPPTPSFNVVGTGGSNQIAQSLAGAGIDEPVRAYVVSTEISTQQELDRRTESEASFG